MNCELQRSLFCNRGFQLSYLDTAPGDNSRPVVLFLHGFPDSAQMWSEQMRFMHQQGYRCIAADTLGCGYSQIATKTSDYCAFKIVEDNIALLDRLAIKQVNVVGHDWGAALAWLLAAYHPERVRRLFVLSVGHPTAYARSGWRQKLAAWYIGWFLLAPLSDRLLPGKSKLGLKRIFSSHPELDTVMQRLSEPGRLQAAVRIYRANLPKILFSRQPNVQCDAFGMLGTSDVFLKACQMRESKAYVAAGWQWQPVDAGHWLSLEHTDLVNKKMQTFFT